MSLIRRRERQLYFKSYALCLLLLFFSFSVRIYGFIGDTSFQKYNLILLVATEAALVFFCIVKALFSGRMQIGSVHIVAIAFWIFTCYSTIINEASVSKIINALINQSFWIIVFIFFSMFLKKQKTDKNIRFTANVAYAFMIVTSLYYIFWSLTTNDKTLSGAVNTIYYSLLLLPVLFIKTGKYSKIRFTVGIIILGVTTLISEKRTALLAFLFALIIPILFEFDLKRKAKAKRLAVLFIGGIILTMLAVLFIELFDIGIIERFKNLSVDGGSGRDDIYKTVWYNFQLSGTKDKMLGHGFNAVADNRIALLVDKYTFGFQYTSAHNDFLEILYDYGIIGMIFYVLFIIQALRIVIKLYVKKSRYFKMALCAVILFVVMSTTSHLILYPTYIANLLMFFAIASNRFRTEKM